MASAWLSLGANIGDPAAQLADAIVRLDAYPGIRVRAQSAVIPSVLVTARKAQTWS